MLTSAVDDDAPASVQIAPAATAPVALAPLRDELPARAVASVASTPRARALTRRQRTGLVLAAVTLGSVLGLAAWRYFEPLPVDSTMTASPPAPALPPRALPLPPKAVPAPPPTATAPAAPAVAAPAPAAPPRTAPGTPVAPPAVPGPCTAAVVALGLCTQNGKPP
jgi:hypothetical protein